MRTQRCTRCNKRLKGPYQYWNFTTGAPRAVCKKCKEIHQPVKQRRQTNEEVTQLLGWSNDKVRNIKAKLKIRGFIDYTFGSPVKILKPYREVVDTPETFKAQIYREMLEVYMEDFRTQDTFKDRLLVGQEIRMILKCV